MSRAALHHQLSAGVAQLIVMRKRFVIAAWVLSVALVCTLCWIVHTRRTEAAHARLVKTENDGGMRRLFVEFEQTNLNVRFTGEDVLSLRVAGHWTEAKKLLLPDEVPLFSRRARQQITFLVPRETEACRFSMVYYRGQRTYCRVYSWLGQHGVTRHAPWLSKVILKLLATKRGMWSLEIELSDSKGKA